MRYIRTEEGFIIDTQNTYPFMISNYMGDKYIDFNSRGRFKIKREADTIKDLCDCFVDYDNEDSAHLISVEDPLRRQGHDIYGAIWTEEGLIYVAKYVVEDESWHLVKRRH